MAERSPRAPWRDRASRSQSFGKDLMEQAESSVSVSTKDSGRLGAESLMAIRLRGMVGVLAVEFVLGVTLGTFWAYDPTAAMQSQAVTTVLDIHMLLALGLLVGSISAIIGAAKAKSPKLTASVIGLLCILGATAGGELVVHSAHQNLGVFLMAIFFLAALLTYGRWLGEVMASLRKG
jgi:hypothetical protein